MFCFWAFRLARLPTVTGSRLILAAAAAVSVLTAALYAPTLGGAFAYDSIVQVVYSDYIHRPENCGEVLTLRVVAKDELDRNRPLLLASLMADAAAWGKNPFGYRLTSVLLHALNAALVCAVILSALARGTLRGGGNVFAAVAGALLFALHPLVVEAVAEPSNREDILVLLAALTGIFAITRSNPERSQFAVNALLAALAFLAVTAKESGVAVPFVFAATVLLFDVGAWRKFVPGLLGGLLAVAGFLAASYALRPVNSAIFLEAPPPLAKGFIEILGVQVRIWALQLFQIFAPVNLSAHYQPEVIAWIARPVAASVVALAAAAGAFAAWKSRLAALGLALSALTLLPASNFAAQFQPVADRYLYSPMAGLGMVAGALLAAAWARLPRARIALVAAAVLVLAAEYSANFRRQQVWREPMSLWADVLRQFPRSAIAHFGVANAHDRAGRFDDARESATQSVLATAGRWDEALALLAACQWRVGRRAEAVDTFRRAVAMSRIYLDRAALERSIAWSPAQIEAMAEIARAAGYSEAPAPRAEP